MKKFIKFIVLIFICTVFISSGTAFANSAAPTPTPDNSGLIFDKFEDVSITKEVLDLKLIDSSIDVKATYWMKNKTSKNLSFETAFISQNYLDDNASNVIIKKNDQIISHTTKQFIRDFDDKTTWEDEFRNQPVYEKTLGDGGGFKLYKIYINDKDNDKKLKIMRPATILSDFSIVKYQKYYQYTPTGGVEFITDAKEIDFGGLNYEVEEIEDIYDYFDKHAYLDQTDEESKNLIVADFLRKVRIDDNNIVNYDFYISSAILYNLDILPNEEITVTVEYNSGTGGRYKSYCNFTYLLSPAKYWSEFKDLTINLTLNKDYPKLSNASLIFEKEGKYQYSYKSNELPKEELSFTARCTGWQSFINNLPYMVMYLPSILIVLSFLIIIIVIIVIVHKVRKKRKKSGK